MRDDAPLRPHTTNGGIWLRPVGPDDLDRFFAHQADPEASWMAAFGPPDPYDRAAHAARWQRILADVDVIARAILIGDEVAGNIVSFGMDGKREIGYWIGRPWWGRGAASEALTRFLLIERTRPLTARVVVDNRASARVLEKCGFRIEGEETSFAPYRGTTVRELVYQLPSPGSDR